MRRQNFSQRKLLARIKKGPHGKPFIFQGEIFAKSTIRWKGQLMTRMWIWTRRAGHCTLHAQAQKTPRRWLPAVTITKRMTKATTKPPRQRLIKILALEWSDVVRLIRSQSSFISSVISKWRKIDGGDGRYIFHARHVTSFEFVYSVVATSARPLTWKKFIKKDYS